MSDYDFKPLNDKEFEILCADLLSETKKNRFERFKPGKDGGVDGRYFSDSGKEIILQCKHWSNTPLPQLIRSLVSIEKPKIDKLSPHQYLLAVSNSLSRANKTDIVDALKPHIKSPSDIYGKEDLNDLLKTHSHIERKHYKLWLYSSSVLGHILNSAIYGRSKFSLEEIILSSTRYVITNNHRKALDVLDRFGVIIITGEPGIGKTTLADHLCLHYVAHGFAYLKIADDIREAESAFDPESKQIIYFDDFLGRNYLDALKGHEGSYITQFIRRIAANKNKRFVLTSRSTILNQGKLLIDSFEHDNIQHKEYELRITSLTEIDKAQILYNHIWHSNLEKEYIEELYIEKRYRSVINHKNFNPRLINYITDVTRLANCSATQYWSYIRQSLANPTQIWENPFIAQQDDFGRSIIFLVVLNGKKIRENILAEAYQRYISLPENQNLQGRYEFQSNIRILIGSFLKRTISNKDTPMIDLFNPSIGDFVLSRYAGEVNKLKSGMLSLKTYQSLLTLKSLVRGELLSKATTISICKALIDHLSNSNFNGADIQYVSSLCEIYSSNGGNIHESNAASRAARFILDKGQESATDDSFRTIEWALKASIISTNEAMKFVASNIDENIVDNDEKIQAITSLLSVIPQAIAGHKEASDSVKKYVIEVAAEDLGNFIDVTEAFSRVQWGEHDEAREELKQLVNEKLSDLGVESSISDIDKIIEHLDIPYELERYFINSAEDNHGYSESPEGLSIDEIDDLFER